MTKLNFAVLAAIVGWFLFFDALITVDRFRSDLERCNAVTDKLVEVLERDKQPPYGGYDYQNLPTDLPNEWRTRK